MLRNVFSNYISGCSTREIAQMLNAEGIPSRGKTKWTACAIRYMLKNEKYKGDFLCQKTYHTGVLPFKQKRNRGEEEQYYIEGSHKGIVSAEVFDLANKILAGRRERAAAADTEEQAESLFAGYIKCKECGSAFNRKKTGDVVYWVCSKHLEDRTLCPSHYIREDRIKDAFVTLTNKLRYARENILTKSITLLEQAKDADRLKNTEAYDAAAQIADLNSKMLMLEQLNAKGYLAPDVYQSQSRELTAKIALLKRDRTEMLASALDEKIAGLKALDTILFSLDKPIDAFSIALFESIVEKVTINSTDRAEFTVKGGLRFTEPL